MLLDKCFQTAYHCFTAEINHLLRENRSQQLLTEYSKQLHQDMVERFGGYSCAYLWELFISQNQDVDINRNVDCVIEDGIALTVDSIYRIMGRMKDDDRAC